MKTLTDNFENMKLKLIDILRNQKYVCTTCDVWTSSAQSYFGATVHFINESYERKSYALAFRPLLQKQTHKELAKEMNNIFTDYGLTNSQITNVVTDGCAALTKSFKKFGGKNDQLTSTAIIEDVPNEDFQNENDDGDNLMPYLQNVILKMKMAKCLSVTF